MVDPLTKNSKPAVAVVLCTFNGEAYIETQIETLATQTYPVAIRVFDDASTDSTCAIVRKLSEQFEIKLFERSENYGYVKNFEDGIKQTLDEGFDYIALSDQDDIWNARRIEEGMCAMLQEEKSARQAPVLVHSDLSMVDADGKALRSSFIKYRDYGISNEKNSAVVLGQNGVMGNTILMNRSLVSMSLPFPPQLHVHDYWIAVVAELFGKRILLTKPLVAYRIHQKNASNAAGNTKMGLARLVDGKSIRGFVQRDFRLPFKEDTRIAVINYLLSEKDTLPKLSSEQLAILYQFQQYLQAKRGNLNMLWKMFRMGFFRRSLLHRGRVTFSLLTTNRYSDKNNPVKLQD